MRMRGQAAKAAFAEPAQGLSQAGRLQNWQLEDGAHRTAHRAAQKRAAGSLAHNQGLGLEGGAIANQGAEILGAGEAIGGGQKSRLRTAGENLLQRKLR